MLCKCSSMGNVNNSKSSENERESEGSSVDPLHLQESALLGVSRRNERKNTKMRDENGKLSLELNNEYLDLSRSNQTSRRLADKGHIEGEGEQNADQTVVSNTDKRTAKFAYGPRIEPYDDVPDDTQNTPSSDRESPKAKDDETLSDLRSPERYKDDKSTTLNDKINQTKEHVEKSEIMQENKNNDIGLLVSSKSSYAFSPIDKDNIEAEDVAIEESQRKDDKEESHHKAHNSTEDAFKPLIEPCDDFQDVIQTPSVTESFELKNKNKFVELSPEMHKVNNSSSDDDKIEESWRHDVNGEMLLKLKNNKGRISAFNGSPKYQADNRSIDDQDGEGPQKVNQKKESHKEKVAVEDTFGCVVELCDDFHNSVHNAAMDNKESLLSTKKDTLCKLKITVVSKKKDKSSSAHVIDHPDNKKDDHTTDHDGEEEVINSDASATIQSLVQKFSESVDSLEQNNQQIMELVNRKSRSQRSIDEEGLKTITELEDIVGIFTERRKEKENAINELKSILAKLTDNVKMLEQEVQTLQSKSRNEADSASTCEKLKNSENSATFTCRKSSGIPESTKTPNNDLKQSKHANSELEHPNSNCSTSMVSDIVRKSIKLDGRKDDIGEGSKHRNLNKAGDDSDSKVNEKMTENNNALTSVSSVKESPSNNDEHVKEYNSTNIWEMNPNLDAESVSSIIPEKSSMLQTDSVSSNNPEINPNPTVKPDSTDTPGNNSSLQSQPSKLLNTSHKPNIIVKQSGLNTKGQRTMLPDGYWEKKATELQKTFLQEDDPDDVCGWSTVLCLDISDSMRGEAFQTMIRLALRFISGVERESYQEKIGVVCFGKDTRVISQCCLNYFRLLHEIRNLEPKGPSPLTAGLLLSEVVFSLSKIIPVVQDVRFFPRLIILSDGMATPELVSGAEDFTPSVTELSDIKEQVRFLARLFKANHNRVYYVPLGQADESIIGPLLSMTHGKVVKPADFDTLIHQFKEERLAAQIRPYFRDYKHAEASRVRTVIEASNASLRGIDLDNVVEYVKNPPPQRRGHSDEDNDDDDDDENDFSEVSTNMPPIGTRVRRGPDWEPSFGSQDSNGPGTVVSQDPDGYLSVMWDNGHRNNYPYGILGHFAVMVVDEPRVLRSDELIETGCLVRRGNDWRDSNHDGGPGSIGVVFKVLLDATVGVRWPTGQLRRYKYGKQGYFEVELCDPFDDDVRLRVLSMNFHESSDISSEFPVTEQVRIEDLVNSEDRENNGILDEMNRKNTTRSNQKRGQLSVNSSHPLHDRAVGKTERKENMQTSKVNSGEAKTPRPECKSVDPASRMINNKEVVVSRKAIASSHVENPAVTDKNNTDIKNRESSNQVPNNIERPESSVENANDSIAACDVIQKVVGEGGLNLVKST